MNRLLNVIGLLLAVLYSAGAVEIVEEELESVSDAQIEFINYEGPHEKIETIEQIKGIGSALSVQTGATETAQKETEYVGKYRILHIVAPAEAEGYNADVFIIEEDAQVDHIANVRRILSGYIESTYGLSSERASALAMFITYYNAIYRGDIEFFKQNYSAPVIAALDPQKVGISRSYNEWPGSTQMVLPLTQLEGAQAPSAESLSTDKVVEEVRTQEDKGVEERKEVVEMREEELEADRRRLEEDKQESEPEQEQVEQQPSRETQEQDTQAQETQEQETQEQETPDQPDAVREDQQEDQQEVDDELEAREEELEQREQAIAEERESIAEDQQELIESEEEDQRGERVEATAEPAEERQKAAATTLFTVFREQNENLYGRIALLKPNGEVAAISTINTIRSREPVEYGGMYVVIAGESSPPRATRLVGLDAMDLELELESETDVYADSPLLTHGDTLWCVIRESGSFYIGEFDEELRLQNRSDRGVIPYTWLKKSGEYILAQIDEKTVKRFTLEDLSAAE